MQRNSFKIDYAGDSEGPGFSAWREGVAQEIQRLDFEPLQQGPIGFTTDVAVFPGVVAANGTTAGLVAIRRTQSLLSDGSCDVGVFVPSSGDFNFATEGQSARALAPDDVGVWDFSCAGEVRNAFSSSLMLLRIERERLDQASTNWEESLRKPPQGREGVGTLLREYVALVAPQRKQLDAAGAALVGQHIIDLAVLALGARGDEQHIAARRGLRAARLERVKALILAELSDVALSIEEIARKFQLSERSIQLMFEESGTTFTDFVLEHRLQTAMRMLMNPALGGSKVSAIALSAGFGDLSYFHRVFRRRFGDTPGAFRPRGAGES